MERVNIKRLSTEAILPKRGTDGSIGFDLYACIENSVTLNPEETKSIGTGVAIELERGYAAFVYARSGLGIKQGIIPANCVGVIDPDYRGEIIVGLKNTSQVPYIVEPKQRIAQLVISKCEIPELVEVDELNTTDRADGGFGSTGTE